MPKQQQQQQQQVTNFCVFGLRALYRLSWFVVALGYGRALRLKLLIGTLKSTEKQSTTHA